MKLSSRYTRAYATITFFVLLIGFTITYSAIKRGTNQSARGKLEHLNNHLFQALKTGKSSSELAARYPAKIKISPLGNREVPEESVVEKFYTWDPELQTKVDKIFVTSGYAFNGKLYSITTNASIIITDDEYLIGIFMTFAWVFVFLLAIVVILSEVLSYLVLNPFNKALDEMHAFQLDQHKTIELAETKTYEFKQLNKLLLEMTDNVKKDYTLLREFTEHASHELQTPLAVIKAQIETLIETDLSEPQLQTISSIHDELERLAKINRSLIILAKLENFDPTEQKPIEFSGLVKESIQPFRDLMRMKKIKLTTFITPQVSLNMDEALAVLLVRNLISNAERHNVIGGMIEVTLNNRFLQIRNTGLQPSIPTEELFGRFKKGNPAVNSVGIGLAIVKKICSLYQFKITYTFQDEQHTVQVHFDH